MTDRELLELAAKAAGIDGTYHSPIFGMTYIVGVDGPEDSARTEKWNPLIDDGDALRLAVKLKLLVDVDATTSFACDGKSNDQCELHRDSDPLTATRRAIVRAAAEIGRSKKDE